jgi:ATP-dependent Lon protease
MRTLPQFPLNLVLFPGNNINLHIFEPRYKQLVRDCLENESPFGIPSILNGKVSEIGTEMNVVKLEKEYPNGEMDIIAKATTFYKIIHFNEKAKNRLYPSALVKDYDIVSNESAMLNEELLILTKLLFMKIGVEKDLPVDINTYRFYDWIPLYGLTLTQQLELVAITSTVNQQKYLIKHLSKLEDSISSIDVIKKKAALNGQFQQFDLLDWKF